VKHTYRFIAESLEDNRWTIAGDELHHLKKVLRLKTGDEVEVCNGKGRWGRGPIVSTEAGLAVVTTPETFSEPASTAPIHIAMAALKHGTVDEFLAALVEVGADQISFFHQDGGEKSRLNPKSHERWLHIVAAAVKQTKRTWLPTVGMFPDLAALVASLGQQTRRYFADELFAEGGTGRGSHEDSARSSILNLPEQVAPAVLVIGSEKGFTERERAVFKAADFTAVGLGANVLRAPTAALVGVGVLALKRQKIY